MPTTSTCIEGSLEENDAPTLLAPEAIMCTEFEAATGMVAPKCDVACGSPPALEQRSSVKLSLEASIAPTWDAQLPTLPAPLLSPSAQVSPFTPFPPLSPAGWNCPLWPTTPTQFSPMVSPHAFKSPLASLPPMLPPTVPPPLSSAFEESQTPSVGGPPSWDAWTSDSNVEKQGATPTTCSGSESGSTTGPLLDEKAMPSSTSEADSTMDSVNDVLSRCATPSANGKCELAMTSPPGLQLPVEPLTLESKLNEKTSATSGREAPRALCLDCLL